MAFVVRQGKAETTVADAESLRQRARDGSLRAHDTVVDPDGTARVAATHPLLASLFAGGRGSDPWAAWKGVESVDASQVYRRMTEDAIPELPAEALEVEPLRPTGNVDAWDGRGPAPSRSPLDGDPGAHVPAAGRPGDRSSSVAEPEPDELTDESVEAIGAPRRTRERATPAPARANGGGADIVAFPGRSARDATPTPGLPTRPRTAEVPFDPVASAERSLPPDLDAYFPPRTQRPERTTIGGASFARLAAFAFALGALGLAGWLWTSIAADRPALARRPSSTSGGAAVAAATTPEQAAASLAMRQTEAGLRTRMAPNPREARTETQLSDALLLDIGQMQVRVRSVKVRVVKYSGRRLDEPRAAEIRVEYLPGDDRARDVGAIALVVGRYARMLRMDLPVFTITDALGQSVAPPALVVDAFYLGRLDLEKFMAGLVTVTVPAAVPATPAP